MDAYDVRCHICEIFYFTVLKETKVNVIYFLIKGSWYSSVGGMRRCFLNFYYIFLTCGLNFLKTGKPLFLCFWRHQECLFCREKLSLFCTLSFQIALNNQLKLNKNILSAKNPPFGYTSFVCCQQLIAACRLPLV